MTDLITFLRARLADDEYFALDVMAETGDGSVDRVDEQGRGLVGDGRWALGRATTRYCGHYHPTRVLAEVEAKRRLIDEVLWYEAKIDNEWGCCHSAEEIGAGGCPVIPLNEIAALRALALPYASHSDYDEAWRPA